MFLLFVLAFLKDYVLAVLTLILLEPKVISLCHHYRASPASIFMQSEQVIYSISCPTSRSDLDIPKIIMDISKKRKVNY